MDDHPYSISNWLTYPNYPDTKEIEDPGASHDNYFVDVLATQKMSQGILHTHPGLLTEYCVGMWYHSTYVEYTSWLTVPCDGVPLLTAGIICEYPIKPLSLHYEPLTNKIHCSNVTKSSVNDSSPLELMNESCSMILQRILQVCPPFWTFISGFCYRVLPINFTEDSMQECILDGLQNTTVSESEFIKRHEYAFLESLHDEYLSILPTPSSPFRIRLTHRCKYIQRMTDAMGSNWKFLTYCRLPAPITKTLVVIHQRQDEDCLPGGITIKMFCFLVLPYWNKIPLTGPQNLSESAIDHKKCR